MVAHDVAAAHGVDGDRLGGALAGDPLPAVARHGVEVHAAAGRDGFRERDRRAGGSVLLVPVVHLDDLGVVAGIEDGGSLLDKVEEEVDAKAHVGRHQHGDDLRGCLDAGQFVGREPRRAEHVGLAVAAYALRHGGNHRVEREIDHDVRRGHGRLWIVRHRHAGGRAPRNRSGIDADHRMTRLLDGRRELEIGEVLDGLDERRAHAAARAHDGDGDHVASSSFRFSKWMPLYTHAPRAASESVGD